MTTNRGNADEEKVLDRQEYQDLQRRLTDAHRSLSDLERKLRFGKKHNYQFERVVSNAVRALDQIQRSLETEFREY